MSNSVVEYLRNVILETTFTFKLTNGFIWTELGADLTPTSQPDLLGDLVNKANNDVNEIDELKNGFRDNEKNSSTPTTSPDLPDISVITNADSVHSNANLVEENDEFDFEYVA